MDKDIATIGDEFERRLREGKVKLATPEEADEAFQKLQADLRKMRKDMSDFRKNRP